MIVHYKGCTSSAELTVFSIGNGEVIRSCNACGSFETLQSMVSPMRFQYLIETLTDAADYSETLWLNERIAEGWEFVAFISRMNSRMHSDYEKRTTFMLRRPFPPCDDTIARYGSRTR